MPLHVGQFLYTSFPQRGFFFLSSSMIPPVVEAALMKKVVYSNWDAYAPPPPEYRAVFVYQVSLRQTLFGWLINDGSDDMGRVHTPYCLGYYLVQPLDIDSVEVMFALLAQGPIVKPVRAQNPVAIASLQLPSPGNYQPGFDGVTVPSDICDRSYLQLEKNHYIQFIHSNL